MSINAHDQDACVSYRARTRHRARTIFPALPFISLKVQILKNATYRSR